MAGPRFPLSTYGGGGRLARDGSLGAGLPFLAAPLLGRASVMGWRLRRRLARGGSARLVRLGLFCFGAQAGCIQIGLRIGIEARAWRQFQARMEQAYGGAHR